MNSETIIPDTTRFTNNPSDVVSLMSIFCIVVSLALWWVMREWIKDRRESNKTNMEVAAALNLLVGNLQNEKK